MLRYFLKRLLSSIPLLLGITLISFILINLAPGSPLNEWADPNLSIEDTQKIKTNLGLNDPIIIQYARWLKEALKGNLGRSYSYSKPVTEMLKERMPATLLLSISSLILILGITLPLGLISGAKKDSFFDNFVLIFSFIGLSIPTFWLGLMLILGFSLRLNILPTSGFMNPQLSDATLWVQIIDISKHLALPLLTIVIGGLASLTRYHRFGIIKILSQDYILAAKARGISKTKLLFIHAFKNASIPIITILGLSLPGLIGGSFVIEYIFSWPGMGQLGISSIFSRDYPVIMGSIVFSSILIILGNLLADIAYTYADPRISLK
jgi:peptide/nickel transport system permease protein